MKSYFTHYSCVVIILFNTTLCRYAFSTDSFTRLVFRLPVLCLNQDIKICFVLTLCKNSSFTTDNTGKGGGAGGHGAPPPPPTFLCNKKKKQKQSKKQRILKQKLLKHCHRIQNFTVLAVLERLEFKIFLVFCLFV